MCNQPDELRTRTTQPLADNYFLLYFLLPRALVQPSLKTSEVQKNILAFYDYLVSLP